MRSWVPLMKIFFLYGEEADIFHRANRLKLRSHYDKKIRYLHLDWDTRGKSMINMNLMASVIHYEKKYNLKCGGYFNSYKVNLFAKQLSSKFSGQKEIAARYSKERQALNEYIEKYR